MSNQTILERLESEESIDLISQDEQVVTIWFRKFFGTKKEFNFQLNGKAVDGCKTKKTALIKIQQFLDKGFKPEDHE